MGYGDRYTEYHEHEVDPNRFDIHSDTMYPTTEAVVTTPAFIWTWQESLLSIPLGLIILGTLFGNGLVLYAALTRSQSLRFPTHYFIANLALADFLVGVLAMPFLATLQVTGRWYFGPVYCEMWTSIHFILCSASILSTCAVCIERYVAVRYPLQHKDIMNRRRIFGMIALVWILAAFLTLSSIYIFPQPKTGEPLVCQLNQQIGHVLIIVVGVLYVPAAIMIILYLRIYMIATKHLKFMKNRQVVSVHDPKTSSSTSDTGFSTSGEESSAGNLEKNGKVEIEASATSSSSVESSGAPLMVTNVQKRKQINLARRLSVLVGVLLASYLPFFTLYMVMAFYPGSVNPHVFSAFGWIRYFNSCINPCIYAFAVPAYRKAMEDIFRKAFRRRK